MLNVKETVFLIKTKSTVLRQANKSELDNKIKGIALLTVLLLPEIYCINFN
jgi:hypothetical protein